MSLNKTVALLLLTAVSRQKLTENVNKSHPQLVNHTFVFDIVRSVHVKFHFRNFVFFVSEQLGTSSETLMDFFQHFWLEFPDVPSTIIGHYNVSYRMDAIMSAPSLCFVFTTDIEDPIMKLAEENLDGVRMLNTIFVLVPLLPTNTSLESHFSFIRFSKHIHSMYAWIWKKQFLNSILLTVWNNVYILDPYPTPTVINKTDEWNVNDFFIDFSVDFKGYVVNTPLLYDIPRAFPVILGNRTHKVTGTSGLLFMAFIESINATYNDSSQASMNSQGFNIDFIIDAIENQTMEISLHSLTFMNELPVGSSYPIGINDWCIMVPFQNRSPEHIFLQRTLQSSTWILILFSGLYLSISIWLCMPQNSRDYSAACLQAVCTLLYIAPTSVLQTNTKRIRCVFFLLFLLGFILSNMFVSRLASYLTSSPQQRQINTVDDIVGAKLNVMVLEFEYHMLVELPQFTPKFLELVIVVDKFTMNKHRDRLNTSYGYSIATDRWTFINKQQLYLRKPLFRLSHICLGPYYHMFPMQNDSHFRDRLKRFLMTANQAGFLDVWEQRTFADALKLKFVRMMMIFEEPIPLSLNFFRPAWLVWGCGMMMAVITVLMEIKWHCLVKLCSKITIIWKWCLTQFRAL